MNSSTAAYVNWREVCSTNRRGRKEVRFYLKRIDGSSDLAVIGKEKKLGDGVNTNSGSAYRYRFAKREKSGFLTADLPVELPAKLRSRREVIDCLTSIVSDGPFRPPLQPVSSLRLNTEKTKASYIHETGRQTVESVWVGSPWICKKKLKHFGAYSRRGVKISVQDFVYVLAEGHRRLVAYINDLYEDSLGHKTAVVQWFHKIAELGLDLPCTYNDKEIFFSLCLQDLSIECIDGPATVLTPQHYGNFLKSNAALTIVDPPFVCQNLFENEVVGPFDLTRVKGYWNQKVVKLLSGDDVSVRPKKRLRKRVDVEYCLGSEIEVLSQDSGIRGVWFRAVVIKKCKDKVKVRYLDIKDAADESVNLEEWVMSSRVAVTDELGIRHAGRMTIRPTRSANKVDARSVDVGCIVDAWLHDGWWEGIVVHKESDNKIHVYFPEEKNRSVFESKDLRFSQEWLENSWRKMKSRPDIINSITDSETTKSNDIVSELSSEENRDFKVDLLANLDWNWSTTKKRHRGQFRKSNSLETVGMRKHDGFMMSVSVKRGCKFTCGENGSSLTSLVMSR